MSLTIETNLLQINETPVLDGGSSYHFLFVGDYYNKRKIVNCCNNVTHIFENFEETKAFLKKTTAESLPDIIIIDSPLNFFELNSFKQWINKNILATIPIIYNEGALNRLEIRNLFHLKLIDDVIKNAYDLELLGYKSNFFKSLSLQSSADTIKIKSREKSLTSFLRVFIKRSIDILISFTGIVVSSPILILIAIIIKITSKGPAIYKSKRAGQGFKVFGFYKFRTMIIDADKKVDKLKGKSIYNSEDGKCLFFKMENDPRVTKIGSFLRNTSIDELPQLFNVLKGDMSLVGNRPLPLYEANSLTTSEWAERFMAPAGITGLWQISKRGKAKMSNEERISLDIDYARKSSIRRDLRILASTPSALIQKQNH